MAARDSSIAAVALVLGLSLVALAGVKGAFDAPAEEGAASRVPMPVIAPGQGERCVYDKAFMRRNHMRLLEHDHDEPRSKDRPNEGHSIRECLSCHAVIGAKGRPVTADSPEHFCRSCHDYAAVTIDCFECHRSRGRRAPAQPPPEPT